MRENHLAYRETARKYKLGNSVCQGKNLAIKWERIYLTEGAEGFMTERRGRGSKADRERSRCRRKSRTISLPRTKG